MSCHLSRLMLAFRPDELAADDRIALEAHLGACPACAAAARAETAADAAIRTAMRAVAVPGNGVTVNQAPPTTVTVVAPELDPPGFRQSFVITRRCPGERGVCRSRQ